MAFIPHKNKKKKFNQKKKKVFNTRQPKTLHD